MRRFDVFDRSNAAVCFSVQDFEFVVFFGSEEEPLSIQVRSKMVEIPILESGKWNRCHQFQGHFFLSRNPRRKANENRQKNSKNTLHAFLSGESVMPRTEHFTTHKPRGCYVTLRSASMSAVTSRILMTVSMMANPLDFKGNQTLRGITAKQKLILP